MVRYARLEVMTISSVLRFLLIVYLVTPENSPRIVISIFKVFGGLVITFELGNAESLYVGSEGGQGIASN